jgi:geranylgeranyl pyrophosphate synthase
LGKTPGKDAQAGKRTYVAELGLDAARSLCDAYTSRATAALEPLGTPAAALLSELAERLTDRSR